MRVIIAGSRGLTNDRFVYEAIHLCPFEFEMREVVSGGARGVDYYAKLYAEANGLIYTEFPANWTQYGKAAGPMRNKQMADYADALLYVRYDSSPGTEDMIRAMHKLGKPIWGITIGTQ
jgi:hypothetical protein